VTAKGEFGLALTLLVLYFQNSIKRRLKDLFLLLGMETNDENNHILFCKMTVSNALKGAPFQNFCEVTPRTLFSIPVTFKKAILPHSI